MRGSAPMLFRLIFNLADNAIKYAGAGRRVELALGTREGTRSSRCATTVPAFRPKTKRTSSTASTAPIRLALAAARGSAWRWRARSSSSTVARSRSRARPGSAPSFAFSCRSPPHRLESSNLRLILPSHRAAGAGVEAVRRNHHEGGILEADFRDGPGPVRGRRRVRARPGDARHEVGWRRRRTKRGPPLRNRCPASPIPAARRRLRSHLSRPRPRPPSSTSR